MTRSLLAATSVLAVLIGFAHSTPASPPAVAHAPGHSDAMMGGETMAHSHATVMDVENGSSILLTPNDPGDLQKLQAEVRMRAQHMRQNGCGMMEHARGS
jgi:hypothetical protein